MEPREIKDLLRFVRNAGFHEFELRMEGFRLRVVKDQPVLTGVSPAQPTAPAPPPAPPAPPLPVPPEKAEGTGVDDGLVEQKAPMVGTFYRAPSPEAEPYVKVGDSVTPGQTLCIIEAMKLMNEIEAETAGTVVEIVPENAQPVEYGEVLFRIRPN
ncbi:MAG: acetyl-CoA carboxylase biotin carboxyl carrier protein [Acidobacteriota bacterium]|nr:acetyl-CoA carboxylase biotin carboxyl carrier protein [Acidobacteriota bacterium]